MLSVSMLLSLLGFAPLIFYLYWFRRNNRTEHSLEKATLSNVQWKNRESRDVAGEKYSHSEVKMATRQPWEYFLVLDVEATCIAGTDFNWPNEIIEWPVVLLTWADRDDDGRASQLTIVDEFRSFVRPTWRPQLTNFCISLTGIAQKDVDSAPTFSAVLDNFRGFLCQHGLICSKTGRSLTKFAWATDGPCDIRDFVIKQCFISKIKVPGWLRSDVIDVRSQVAAWLAQKRNDSLQKTQSKWTPSRSLNISRQLSALSLPPFQGRQHSGIDDTRNIARILTELARRGVKLEPNLKIHPGRRWYWMGNQLGEIYEEYFP